MIKISNADAPLFIQALRDAVAYHERRVEEQDPKDRADDEEYLVIISQFFADMKSEYKIIEKEVGIPLEDLL